MGVVNGSHIVGSSSRRRSVVGCSVGVIRRTVRAIGRRRRPRCCQSSIVVYDSFSFRLTRYRYHQEREAAYQTCK